MRVNGIKLSTTHLFWFYSVTSILYLSGIFWLFLHFGPSKAGQTEMSGIHPLEPWSLKIHGASAMFFLVIFGTLIPNHVRRGWIAKMNRANGVVLIIWNVLLIVSAYCLYYIGNEDVREFSSWSHIILGAALPILFFIHITTGRRARHKRIRRHHPHESQKPQSA